MPFFYRFAACLALAVATTFFARSGMAADYWYYCYNPRGYYPNVPACRIPWQKVLPIPSAPTVAPTPYPPGQPPPYSVSHPQITSVTTISPTREQQIVISGHGFGSAGACYGDTSFLRIHDGRNWNAGYNRNGQGCQSSNGGDQVTLNIASWTDTRIVIEGFSGRYGTFFWSLREGDEIEIQLTNPQTRQSSNQFRTYVTGYISPPSEVYTTPRENEIQPAPAPPAVALPPDESQGDDNIPKVSLFDQ